MYVCCSLSYFFYSFTQMFIRWHLKTLKNERLLLNPYNHAKETVYNFATTQHTGGKPPSHHSDLSTNWVWLRYGRIWQTTAYNNWEITTLILSNIFWDWQLSLCLVDASVVSLNSFIKSSVISKLFLQHVKHNTYQHMDRLNTCKPTKRNMFLKKVIALHSSI